MCDYCSWIEKLQSPTRREILPITVCTNVSKNGTINRDVEDESLRSEPTILVHGTATSACSEEEMNDSLESIEEAAIEGYRELVAGADAVDSIEAAIRHLESEKSSAEPKNSGNESEENKVSAAVIKDAAVMDSDSKVGSVGALVDAPHPIALAKILLRNTDHVLVVGSGAENLQLESDENFDGRSIESKVENREKTTKNKEAAKGLQIYGAVARDKKGRLACGISTLDDRNEAIERCSMSAAGTVIGCGIFADAHSCCSVSGKDATIYAYAPARRVVERFGRELREDNPTKRSIRETLASEMGEYFASTGESSMGMAALSIEGEARVAFESRYFPWARCNRGAITSGYVEGRASTKEIPQLDMPLDCKCD